MFKKISDPVIFEKLSPCNSASGFLVFYGDIIKPVQNIQSLIGWRFTQNAGMYDGRNLYMDSDIIEVYCCRYYIVTAFGLLF